MYTNWRVLEPAGTPGSNEYALAKPGETKDVRDLYVRGAYDGKAYELFRADAARWAGIRESDVDRYYNQGLRGHDLLDALCDCGLNSLI